MSNIVNNYQFKKTLLIKPESDGEIVIVDYGMGNLGSIKNMFEAIGSEAEITSDLGKIKNAQKLILPGVGSFDNGMENLKKLKLNSVLNELVMIRKTPILGICLGMQLMTEKSEEGKSPGLGWIKGETKKFANQNFKIPHMGWNNVKIVKKHPLAEGLNSRAQFYFVHSYFVLLKENRDELLQTNYGGKFTSAFQRANIFGVQFHPEKSHKFGMQLLKNFAEGKNVKN